MLASSMKLYHKNFDDLIKERYLNKFDNVTYKTIKHKHKIAPGDMKKFLLNFDNVDAKCIIKSIFISIVLKYKNNIINSFLSFCLFILILLKAFFLKIRKREKTTTEFIPYINSKSMKKK